MSTILVVDDKASLRDSVGLTLQRAGFTPVAAQDGPDALSRIARKRPDAVVSDLKMPGMDGVELLARIRELDEDLPVILMTAYGSIQTAVEAMRLGAYTYLTKPFEGDELIVAVKRALEHAKLKRENALLKLSGRTAEGLEGDGVSAQGVDRIVGVSDAMQQVREQIRAVACSQGTVLITGESGVGKEVVARAVHESSPRAAEAYLAVNCAALSESLLESELFGHEKGAFTGADQLRKGRFELADRGTLLLDEISEISPKIQAKLLRVLQERSFERVGSSTTIGVDVRVIATTNRSLPEEVARGAFRQDLYFRLNVLPVSVPPLRARLDDVPPLAEHFIGKICARDGLAPKRFSDEAMRLLCSYGWPGNVRELQNICERAVVLCKEEVIRADLIRPWLQRTATPPPTRPGAIAGEDRGSLIESRAACAQAFLSQATPPATANGDSAAALPTLEEIERQAILDTLRRFNGHRQKTAEALGIGVRTLGLKLKKWKEAELVAPDV